MNAHAKTRAGEIDTISRDLAWPVPSALRSWSPAGAVTSEESRAHHIAVFAGPAEPRGEALLGDLADGFWTAITNTPWLGALFALVVLTALVRFVREIIHSGHPKDAVRRLNHAERRMILARAGHPCGHHFAIFSRCRATTGLEADHVYPHSRGG